MPVRREIQYKQGIYLYKFYLPWLASFNWIIERI